MIPIGRDLAPFTRRIAISMAVLDLARLRALAGRLDQTPAFQYTCSKA